MNFSFKKLTPLLFIVGTIPSFGALPNNVFPSQILNLSHDERIATTALLADKSKRQLSLLDHSSLDAGTAKLQYKIDIGKKSGNKKKRDDRRTPEGIYLLLTKKLQPEIPFQTYGSMAFTTDYPNFFDRNESKTGSGIWLHSVPDSIPMNRGSKGCVVLRNNDIKNLDPYILLKKTFMIIDSQIHWLTENEHLKEKNIALEWLEQWRTTWEKQDIENYIDNYSDEFSSPPFNKKTWYSHKQKLKERYNYVKVEASEPNIFQVKDNLIFQFVQNYESNEHKDIGVKSLYVLREGKKFRIAREEWTELK